MPELGLAFGVSGGLLQILGILVVVWQIIEIRKAFNLPSILSLIVDWFRRWKFILGKQGTVSEASMDFIDGLQMGVTAMDGAMWAPPLPTDSTDQKIEKLAKWVENLQKTVMHNASKSHSELQAAKNEFRQLVKGVEEKHVIKEENTINALTGNHTTEILGVMLVLLGVCYSTIGLIL